MTSHQDPSNPLNEYEAEAVKSWRDLCASLRPADLMIALEGGMIVGDLKIAFMIEGLPRHDEKSFDRLLWEPTVKENDASGYLDFETSVTLRKLRALVASFEFSEAEQASHPSYGTKKQHQTEMRLIISVRE